MGRRGKSQCWHGEPSGEGRLLEAVPDSALDRGFLGGESLFETMRLLPGARLPLLELHLERLARGCAELDLPCPSIEAVRAAATALAGVLPFDDGILRLAVGPGREGPEMLCSGRERVLLDRPLRLFLCSARRDVDDPSARRKSTARLFWQMAQLQAEAAGADQALALQSDGALAETTVGNLFARIDGRIVTPGPDGAFLPGVARRVLLEAPELGITERRIEPEELAGADGLWVSNAVHGPRAAVLPGLVEAPPADDPLAPAFRARIRG